MTRSTLQTLRDYRRVLLKYVKKEKRRLNVKKKKKKRKEIEFVVFYHTLPIAQHIWPLCYRMIALIYIIDEKRSILHFFFEVLHQYFCPILIASMKITQVFSNAFYNERFQSKSRLGKKIVTFSWLSIYFVLVKIPATNTFWNIVIVKKKGCYRVPFM